MLCVQREDKVEKTQSPVLQFEDKLYSIINRLLCKFFTLFCIKYYIYKKNLKQLFDCTSVDSKCFSRKSLCGWQLLSRNAGCGAACGEEASAAAGAAAGRGGGRRPGRWPGSGVAVRPCCGTEPGSEAGTSPGGLEERGSPAPPASASSSCSGTRSSPERSAKIKLA